MTKGQAGREIVHYARLMYEKEYTVATEGNISIRLSENRVLITPSGKIKKFLEEKDLTEINMQGEKLKGKGNPTTERFTHLEIYEQNPDVKAIVHAHPFYTVLTTVLKQNPFEKMFISEAAMFLKNVKIAPYAKPSTKEGADAVRELCRETKILILDRHGSFTYGNNLASAFSSLEILEKYCKMAYYAELSGKEIAYIPEDEIEALKKVEY